MLSLLTQGLFGVALLLLLGAVVELRTAWRFGRVRPGRASDPGSVAVEGTVDADDGVVLAPLSNTPCVQFSCVLVRCRLDHSGRSALLFTEQRPFVVTTNDARVRIDVTAGPVVVTGLDAMEYPLQFLPQSVLGLLVQRFGHMGHIWAEDYVVSGRESCLAAGARVHALVHDGVVLTVSTKPMQALGRAALVRGLQAVGVGVTLAVAAWWLRSL
jgi:hypothetical protein